jgi:hypothetical protein
MNQGRRLTYLPLRLNDRVAAILQALRHLTCRLKIGRIALAYFQLQVLFVQGTEKCIPSDSRVRAVSRIAVVR